MRQHLDGRVRRDRTVAQLLLQIDGLSPLDCDERHLAECGEDVAAEHAADLPLRVRLQPHLDMLFQLARCEVGHGRAAVNPGGKRQGHRLLARLDAGDDERRPLAGLVGMEHVVPADRHPLRPVRPPRLGDVDLAARGIDPDPEAGQLVVPGDPGRVGRLERIDDPLGQLGLALSGTRRHGRSSVAGCRKRLQCALGRFG